MTVAPSRILDSATGVGATKAKIATKQAISFTVKGKGGIPTTGVSAVALALTVTGPASSGTATAYSSDATRPAVANLTFTANQKGPA